MKRGGQLHRNSRFGAKAQLTLDRDARIEARAARMANLAEIHRAAPPVARSVVARVAGPAPAVPKRDYVRSPALMQAYRAIPCQHCGAQDGTVCGAHANWAEFGKGGAIKASDDRAASLCFTCHGMLDQGSILGAAERMAMWWIAHTKTVNRLLALGLWPKAVPVPELRWERIA